MMDRKVREITYKEIAEIKRKNPKQDFFEIVQGKKVFVAKICFCSCGGTHLGKFRLLRKDG